MAVIDSFTVLNSITVNQKAKYQGKQFEFAHCGLFLHSYRHPDYHQRVSFDDLTAQLAENPDSLLAWTEEDRATAPQASVLGAPLEEGTALYQDLQKMYNGARV